MNLSQFIESWDNVQAENKFYRFMLLGLVVTNFVSAIAAMRADRTVVLVPPHLNTEVEIARNNAASQLKESWGLYLAELLGNVTPDNTDFIQKAISPLLSSAIYREVINAMTEQANAIRIDNVATSYKPREVLYEPETDKVFVTGELTTYGLNNVAEKNKRTYEFKFDLDNYRPRLTRIDVYRDEPRTLEFFKLKKDK